MLKAEYIKWKELFSLVSRYFIELCESSKKNYRTLILLITIFFAVYCLGFQSAYVNNFAGPIPNALGIRKSGTSLYSSNDQAPVKKIAFLYLVQTTLPLAPLWAKFFKNYENFYTVYINLNPGHSLDLPVQFSGATYSTQDTSSGGGSLLEAELLMLSSALQNRGNEWFILLSEYCIPLYNFEYFYNFLSKSPLNYVSIITDEAQSSISRYSNVLAPEIPREAWTKGSRWFELNRDMAMKVTMDRIYISKFKLFCPSSASPKCVPNEHYLHTFTRITAPQLLSNHSLTWENWDACGRCFDPREYSFIDKMIIDSIKSAKCMSEGVEYPCFLLARIFNEKSLPDLLRFALYLGY